MSNDMNNAASDPQPAELAEQQGVGAPDCCEECGRRTFHNHPDGYICLHCKLIVGSRPQDAQFALDALVAVGHVEQGKVDQALAIGAALAATGKQQGGEVQGDVMVMEALAYFERVGDAGDHKYVEAIRAALAELVVAKVYAGAPGPYLGEPDAPSNPLWKRLRSIANWLTLLAPNCHMEAAELLLSASDRIKRSEVAPQVGEARGDGRAMLLQFGEEDLREGSRSNGHDGVDHGDWVDYIEVPVDVLNQIAATLAARQPGAQEPVAWRYHAEGDATKWYYSDTASLLGLYQPLYDAPPSQGIDLVPRPMDTAPRDGTMVRLLVQFTEHATEDTDGPSWTIGANNHDHDGEDVWKFAGWCWTHDHFTEGKGTPVGWLPLIEGQRDAAPGVGNG